MYQPSTILGITLAALMLCGATSATAANESGKKYALLVGVKEYDHRDLGELAHPEHDVEELAEVLRGRDSGFAEVVVLSTTRAARDASLKPTAAVIRAQLKKLASKVTKRDQLLIALAGHGLQLPLVDPKTNKERDESFFCPCDARPRTGQSLDELKRTMIPLGELFRELDESGAGVRLLLVDACRNDPLSSRGRNIDLDTLPRPSQGTAALFSCKGGEKAFETSKLGKKGHGVFFHHVIEGLKGKAANDRGEVTWARMADYVIERVSDDVPQLIGGGARQTPHEVKNLIGISPVLAASKLDAEMLAGWFQKGEEYLHGRGVARDPAEALLWYRKAAARGHAGAMKQLGWMYQKGLGVKPSHTEAMAWYRKSAARGNAAAINQLGWMHQNGLGVAKDDAEAIRHYRRAAQQGHAVAMFNLAFLMEKGRGTGANLKEALTWYRKAAELGDAPARQRVDQLERTSTK